MRQGRWRVRVEEGYQVWYVVCWSVYSYQDFVVAVSGDGPVILYSDVVMMIMGDLSDAKDVSVGICLLVYRSIPNILYCWNDTSASLSLVRS